MPKLRCVLSSAASKKLICRSNEPGCRLLLKMGKRVPQSRAEEERMLLILAVVLLLLWAGGFFVFHVAGFFIHILIILAVISLIVHFLRGGRTV